MSFADSAAIMRDSIFTRGGEDAVWLSGGVGGGAACKVLRAQPDQAVNFGDQRAIVPTAMFRVRRSEIPAAGDGDTVTIGADTFQIIGVPTMDKYRQVWTCEAVLAD